MTNGKVALIAVGSVVAAAFIANKTGVKITGLNK